MLSLFMTFFATVVTVTVNARSLNTALHQSLPRKLGRHFLPRGAFAYHSVDERTNKRDSITLYSVPSVLSYLAVARNNPWYVWSILSLASSVGISSDKTRIGSLLSSPLVTMVLCLVLCNVGLLPAASPVYVTISKVFVPLAVPLLLLDADIRKCFFVAKRLLKAFVLGSLGTVLGTIVAYWLVPMKALEGGSKVASALCARHIGGAVNFVAVAEILRIPPELVAAAIAADNLIVAVYFSFLFVISAPSTESSDPSINQALPSTAVQINSEGNDGIKDINIFELDTALETIPVLSANNSSAASSTSRCPMTALFGSDGDDSTTPPVAAVLPIAAASQPLALEASKPDEVNLGSLSAALTMSLLICTASMALSSLTSISHMLLLSAITVFLATAFPVYIGGMSRAGGTLGVLFMQLFFAATGAVGHIPTVMGMASSVLAHTTVQIVVHFLFIMGMGRLLKLPFRELVLASNANVGGPTTASAMAVNKNWRALVLPALLTGVFGFAIATQIGVLVFQLLTKLRG